MTNLSRTLVKKSESSVISIVVEIANTRLTARKSVCVIFMTFFLDTGLGRDSFSIISQGKVEEIFNSKPEERRAIFEEAAGVLKYKTRRKETESKLQQTQDNLDRLEDIIYELDNQIKPLAKQAENARKFLDLDGQRKAIYLDVLVAQIKENKAELESTEEELAQVQELLTSYYQKREKLEEENQALKKQRQDLQAEMDQRPRQFDGLDQSD